MLYAYLKIHVRLAAFIFCRKFIINKPALLKEKGPLLLASNHPNSFLDAVILDILFEQPVWSLARGDAFLNKTISRLFKSVKMLPVYRTSEGVENLGENYKTFDSCIEIFKKNGLVQIFGEGKCINEWHLRPLKKGTARLTLNAWEKNIPLKVLPVGINYNSFRKFGKNIIINFGEIITAGDINLSAPEGFRYQQFNHLLKTELEKTVFEIDKNDSSKKMELLGIKLVSWKKPVLFLPACIGYIVHTPLYFPVRSFVLKKFSRTDHFDSVLIAILLFAYPVYLMLLVLGVWCLYKSWLALFLILVMPVTAWSYVQLKKQID